jgi:hypothetical protein
MELLVCNKNGRARICVLLTVLLLAISNISNVMADQVLLSYPVSQTLTLDSSSAVSDLAFAASLLGGEGVTLSLDKDTGDDSLVDIARAWVTAAPAFAEQIAAALMALSPADATAIQLAISEVTSGTGSGGGWDGDLLLIVEQVASPN